MKYLFNLAYLALLLIALPWLVWQRLRHGKYRDGWPEKLLGRVPKRSGHRPCIWLHAVSVGEVNLLQTMLGRLELEHPECDIVISTTTQTGFALAQKKYLPRTVFYAPLDFSWATHRAVRRLRPDLLILAELEVWPNLVGEVKRRGGKVAVINGRLSEGSFHGYKRFSAWFRSTFGQLDLVAAQNEEYAERFRALGCDASRVGVTGSIKFDGARSDRNNAATMSLARLARFEPVDCVLLAGSTQAGEEELAITAFQQLDERFPQLRLVLVPRHPERFDDVARMLDSKQVAWQRRSKLGLNEINKPRILLVDAIGELGAWWGTATIAYVGGSMGNRGGQNMIEPAAYGAAVSFGPNTWNFRDVVQLFLAADAAVVVNDGAELTRFVERCLTEPEYAAELGQKAAALVRTQQGAADRTLKLIGSLLANPNAPRAAA